MFRIPNVDGQRISVFAIDLIMAIEYVLCAKQIAPQGRISVGVLKLLGDLFAWLSKYAEFCICGSLWLNSATSKFVLFGYLLRAEFS